MVKWWFNIGIVKFNIRNGILFEINFVRVIIEGKYVNRGVGYGLVGKCFVNIILKRIIFCVISLIKEKLFKD